MSGPQRPRGIVVLGVGNPIMADDGLGLVLLERLRAARPDPRVQYVDGVAGGLELLPEVTEASRLLILDAVAGRQPGECRQVEGDAITVALGSKLSPHQVGLLDVLGAARLLGQEPDQVTVVGVTPAAVELGLELTPVVQAALDGAVARAVGVLDAWLAEA
ncbi:MAG: hydrogenase maturation protease [Bifidobacteriaceae bacterium]|jgi:hydrogenase maturation protease|nr:hydrogenase maturation protease [Bifidobacteriaceae bacterium]